MKPVTPFSILSVILLIAFSTLSSCGGDYNKVEVKDYRLQVKSSDPAVHNFFYTLIQDFNERAGIDALSYVSNPNEANSTIELINGLRLQDKKVGWGQWVKETQTSGVDMFSNSKPTKTIMYSMKVEFDEEYMTSRLDLDTDEKNAEVFKLFAHETGHGFLFEHHPDPTNVMYYDVSGEKEYSSYFKNVQAFFAQ
ncbi:hypothetical protein N9D31_03815 [Oligoflexaceae bacterium]|nr:hypothetical protein [Oligoflexaceae bacterium]